LLEERGDPQITASRLEEAEALLATAASTEARLPAFDLSATVAAAGAAELVLLLREEQVAPVEATGPGAVEADRVKLLGEREELALLDWQLSQPTFNL
jgi:hypothetical protein